MNWTDMIEAQFDRSKVPDAKTRKVIETAPETLFPSLLPEVQPLPSPSLTEPMPGQASLFALDES